MSHQPTNDELRVAAQTRKTRDVPVPSLGEGWVITLRELTGDEIMAWEKSVSGLDTVTRGVALIVRMAVNADGSARFSESDREWIAQAGWGWVGPLTLAGYDLNGLTTKAVDATAKN